MVEGRTGAGEHEVDALFGREGGGALDSLGDLGQFVGREEEVVDPGCAIGRGGLGCQL
jgi:hypothetical protein